eukprot:gene21900-27977_t
MSHKLIETSLPQLVSLGTSPALNHGDFLLSLDVLSACLCREHFPNGLLSLFISYTPARFDALGQTEDDGNGNDVAMAFPALPTKPVRPAANASSASIAFYHEDTILYTSVTGSISLVRNRVLEALGDIIRTELMGLPGGLALQTLPDILQYLEDVYGTPDEQDLRVLLGRLTNKFVSAASFRSEAPKMKLIFDQLALHEQPISELEQQTYLQEATELIPAIVEAIKEYKRENRSIQDRSFSGMVAHIKTYLPAATASDLGYVGATVVPPAQQPVPPLGVPLAPPAAVVPAGPLVLIMRLEVVAVLVHTVVAEPVHMAGAVVDVQDVVGGATVLRSTTVSDTALVLPPRLDWSTDLKATHRELGWSVMCVVYLESVDTSSIADCGATDTLVRASQQHKLQNVRPIGGLSVSLPNGNVITSVATGVLPVPSGSSLVIPAHVFSDSHLDRDLISLADYCTRGCTALLTDEGISISDATGHIVATAMKVPGARLWPLPLATQSAREPPVVCAVQHHELNADFVAFAHASLGSPTMSTLLNALRRGYLKSYPRLTSTMVAANDPVSIATARGHLDLTRQGQTHARLRLKYCPVETTDEDDFATLASELGLFVRVVNLSSANHSDGTSQFPIQSRRGNNYVLVSVFNGYIHSEAMASRKGPDYVKAFRATLDWLAALGHSPTIQRLDNETSGVLERFFQERHITVQFVPPNNHRANKAERAIRTFKNHFISVLGTVHESFPLDLWDELLPQVDLCLNILRPFGPRPEISAYEGIHGSQYDFSAHPIAPCGTHVLIHETPEQRASWAPHGVPGFYLGPAPKHFRAYRVFAIPTQSSRVTDTVAWLSAPFKMPGSSTVELVHAATRDLTVALNKLAQSGLIVASSRQPFERLVSTATSALQEAVEMFMPSARSSDISDPHTEQRVPVLQSVSPLPDLPATLQRVVPAPQSLSPPPGLPVPLQRVVSDVSDVAPTPAAAPAPDSRSEQRVPPLPVTHPTAAMGGRVRGKRPRAPRVSSSRPVAVHVTPVAIAASPVETSAAVQLPSGPACRRVGRRRLRPVRYRHDEHLAALAHNLHAHSASAAISDQFVHRASAYAALNLTPDGRPLTYARAKSGPNADDWFVADGEEICRLIDSGTIWGIRHTDQPADRRGDTTYYNQQPKEKLAADGSVTRRIRGTAGGDKVHFPGDVSARTAEMEVVKALIHSAASDRAKGDGGQFMTLDIKDFYLGTPMERYEYIRIPVRAIPDSVLDKYSLRPLIHRDAVLFEIRKCMYGLPQAGLLSQQRLIAHLAAHGYTQDSNVPCLFHHAERRTAFTLVVDDFAVKYKTRADAEHLISSLQLLYELKINWTGDKYLGYHIVFDDTAGTVSLSMPEYIPKMLERFFPGEVLRGVASPEVYTPPQYGAHVQHAQSDESAGLSGEQVHRLQEIVGCLLFYARAVDCTMLTAINHISSEQARPTERVMEMAQRLLRYAASYPSHELVYSACDMVLHIQSDASYLSRSGARSVAGGILYCGQRDDPHNLNGALLAVSGIIPTVCSSVAEAEYAACFINAQHGVWLRTVLTALGYPQPSTVLLCDNRCAVGLATDTIKVKRSKAIDMRYHWLRDRIRNGDFRVLWCTGVDNVADFFTKALPVHRHQHVKRALVRCAPSTTVNPSHNKRVTQSRHHRAFKYGAAQAD